MGWTASQKPLEDRLTALEGSAIIESGHSDGVTFWKFANGLMIQQGIQGSGPAKNTNLTEIRTLAAHFKDELFSVQVHAVEAFGGALVQTYEARAFGTNQFRMRFRYDFANNLPITYQFIAIGRWK